MAYVGTPNHSTPTPSSLSAPSPVSAADFAGPLRQQKRKSAAAGSHITNANINNNNNNNNNNNTGGNGSLGFDGSPGGGDGEPRLKVLRVTRACDHCKAKKMKCTGTLPCANCTAKGLPCLYEAVYRRGRPITPPPAATGAAAAATAAVVPSPSPSFPLDEHRTSMRTSSMSVDRQPSTGQGEHRHIHEASRESSTAQIDDTSGRPSVSRASPELEAAEIEGQYVDPTSNLTFLHRAWRRLASQKNVSSRVVVPGATSAEDDANAADDPRHQPMTSAGDRPLACAPPGTDATAAPLYLDRATAGQLFAYYFNMCVVTYRCLHQPTVARWLDQLLANVSQDVNLPPNAGGLGHARAAIVLCIFAIASLRREKLDKSVSTPGEADLLYSLHESDRYFAASRSLTEAETGFPLLESAQARILQVLYLLQTSRMNQAWYVFGSVLPIASALGLHRRSHGGGGGGWKKKGAGGGGDYIMLQCRKRTFWVAYTIDKYLAVVFGRPRLYHDDDINQDFPDRVNDEDMTPAGPSMREPQLDCHLDSLVFHAKLAQIIDAISREVYSFKRTARRDRLAAAEKYGRALHEWREGLPPHLGTVRPKSLTPPFRREATALRLAYCHAIMHANRPFLWGGVASRPRQGGPSPGSGRTPGDSGRTPRGSGRTPRGGGGGGGGGSGSAQGDSVVECISAAKMALEVVDDMVADGAVFHALWWTPYVTFCALAVVYVWEIQQQSQGGWSSQSVHGGSSGNDDEDSPFAGLFELAERCQGHLARATAADSPSRRYSVILEELRLEARQQFAAAAATATVAAPAPGTEQMPAWVAFPGQQDLASTGLSAGGGVPAVRAPELAAWPHHENLVGPAGANQLFVDPTAYEASGLVMQWQTTDWLDLDSSAFGPFPGFEGFGAL